MNTNDKVKGSYYGKPFTGTVTDIRPYYGWVSAEVITIKADAPVKTPSGERDIIQITAHDGIGIGNNNIWISAA